MIGISEELAVDLAARGYTDADVARIFGPKAYAGELRVIYDRGNGDRTSPLPSSRHAYYYGAKNWVAVAIADDPAQAGDQLVDVPTHIQESGDRMAVWSRKGGRDTTHASCKQAASMLSKGWTFVELCDEERLRAVAEARPIPSATVPVQSKQESPAPAPSKGGAVKA
jgi:hypothetical protein